MRITMKTHITGYRNGIEWPPVGTVIEIIDHEALDLIAAGLAEEAPDAEAEFVAPEFLADPDSGAPYESAPPAADEPDDAEPADGTASGEAGGLTDKPAKGK